MLGLRGAGRLLRVEHPAVGLSGELEGVSKTFTPERKSRHEQRVLLERIRGSRGVEDKDSRKERVAKGGGMSVPCRLVSVGRRGVPKPMWPRARARVKRGGLGH